MKLRTFAAVTALTVCFSTASAFAETWSGTISDSMCAAKHVNATKEDIACAQKCVEGGDHAVFVAGGKIYNIDNPDAVKGHIGHKVMLTGTMKEGTIHVDSVKM